MRTSHGPHNYLVLFDTTGIEARYAADDFCFSWIREPANGPRRRVMGNYQ